jgi:aspartate/methionine/tyrosine aminotransferase
MSHREIMKQVLEMPWLSQAMKRAMLPEYVEEGLPSQILALQDFYRWNEESPKPVITLSAGAQLPSVAPAPVRARAKEAIDEGGYLKNWLPLRQGLARRLQEERGMEVDSSNEILITTGGQLAIEATYRVLLDPGDEVLIIDPEYACFEPMARMHGARVVPVPLQHRSDGGWFLDLELLRSQAGPQTRLLVMTNPNNPTGIVYSEDELAAILELAEKHDFFVFVDEVWSDLVFPEHPLTSMGALPGGRERTITGVSFSKTFAMSGYRVGAVIAPPKMIEFMASVVRFTVQAPGTHDQKAALAALEQGPGWLEHKLVHLRENREYAVRRLNGMPGVRCDVPEATYFVFPDIRETGLPSLEFARRALLEEGVSVLPGILFGRNGEGHLRLSYAVPDDDLSEGMDRLERVARRAVEKGKQRA